jgi:AcrR family transcriptional regulator
MGGYNSVATMSRQNRKYELRVRAEQLAETRRRIVEAAAALHEEVGPARTTVAEIARRAGVRRPTVYNHFPNEKDLFLACGQHSLAQKPPPDPSAALAIADPSERLRALLTAFYGWYRQVRRARENLERDRLLLPALDAAMKIRLDHTLAALADALAAGLKPPRARAKDLRATVALALDFWTWRRLASEGLSDGDAAALMVSAAKVAAGR